MQIVLEINNWMVGLALCTLAMLLVFGVGFLIGRFINLIEGDK
jgi:hypothetical protein